jgi:hypothetical protein
MKPQIVMIGLFMVGCVWANPDFDYPMASGLERPAEAAEALPPSQKIVMSKHKSRVNIPH